MKTKQIELYFNLYDALLEAAKKQITENVELDPKVLETELEKISLEFEDGGHAYTDQDSGNLYHANYFAEGYIEYEGNNPEITKVLKELEDQDYDNPKNLVDRIYQELESITETELMDIAKIGWDHNRFIKTSPSSSIYQITSYIETEVIGKLASPNKAIQNINTRLDQLSGKKSLTEYIGYLISHDFINESELLG